MHVPVLVLLAAAYLAGCGYKGPLTLPKPQSETTKQRSVVTPEPAPDRPVPAEAVPPPR